MLLFVLFMLLLDAEMTSSLQGTVISVALLLANTTLTLVVFVDTKRSEMRKNAADRREQQQVCIQFVQSNVGENEYSSFIIPNTIHSLRA